MSATRLRRRGKVSFVTLSAVLLFIALACALAAYQPGGASAASVGAAPKQPAVVYANVVRADLSVPRTYAGQVEAIQFVNIIPRVAGEIKSVNFTEGSTVNEGDVLFTIDPSQYQATVALRQADVAQATADHNYAVKYHSRLKASDQRSIKATDLEAAESRVAQTKAAVDQANAALKLAQIDLSYCTIKAPITGQIGRASLTRGNYVTPASGSLASIAQIDPIRVRFSVPDRDYLASIEEFKTSGDDVFTSKLILPDGSEYPFSGARDFEDNTMDSSTGTMTLRVRFSNAHSVLVPGTVVRVVVKPTKRYVSVVVPSDAVMSTPKGDIVYVVDKDDKIEARPVAAGEDFGTMTEIKDGLVVGERVVIRGLLNVRPGMTVTANPEKAPGEGETPADRAKRSGLDLVIIPTEEIK